MNNIQLSYDTKVGRGNLTLSLALLVFIATLVFNGTFFRIRPAEELPEMDWLILARLITSALGFVIGAILILKSHARLGFGSIVLLLFLIATGISAINSPYPTIVIGYGALLLGASILVLGLVYSAPDINRLEQFEKIWFVIVGICAIKDAITSFIFPDPAVGEEITRLGMGTTHANQLGLLAGLVFWLSFKQTKANSILWLFRIAMLGIILGAISRVGILAFLVGGFTYFFFRAREVNTRLIFLLTCLSGIVFVLLIFSLNPHWGNKVVVYGKRGQSQIEFFAFTGRTDIWRQAIRQIPDAPITGHGYGITRFTLKPIAREFQADHCHNEMLEALFSTGLLGLIALLLLYIYNLKWLLSFSRLKGIFSSDLVLHASTIVVMFLVSAIFEARISIKLLPFQLLFFFYLLILDREKQFTIIKTKD